MTVLVPLLLGLLSWGLGIAAIFQKQRRHRHFYTLASFICCCGSLYCCLQSIWHWVKIEDVSAILDCTGAFCFCAAVLIGGTVVLNTLAFVRKTP